MKYHLLLISLILISAFAMSQSKPEKIKPVEKRIAKDQVMVKLEKQKDENGKDIIVSHTTKIKIPESFPNYIDTGDPKKDENVYHEAKMKWIKEHPEGYEKIKHLNL